MELSNKKQQQNNLTEADLNLTRAPLRSAAERAPLGGGGKCSPSSCSANSRTSNRSEAGEAAIESHQRVLV